MPSSGMDGRCHQVRMRNMGPWMLATRANVKPVLACLVASQYLGRGGKAVWARGLRANEDSNLLGGGTSGSRVVSGGGRATRLCGNRNPLTVDTLFGLRGCIAARQAPPGRGHRVVAASCWI